MVNTIQVIKNSIVMYMAEGCNKMLPKGVWLMHKIKCQKTTECESLISFLSIISHLKDSGTFSKCPQIYIKFTGFEDNDSGKLPFKYY